MITAAEVSNKVAADYEVADKRVREESARGERGPATEGPAIEYLRAQAWRGKHGRKDQIVISWRHLS